MKKTLTLLLCALLIALTATACAELPRYLDLKVGEDYTDVKADLMILNHRTDLADTKYPEYIGASCNGTGDFTNRIMIHSSNPFSDRGDGTGPYAMYKVLYDAAALHLIEDDYTTTDWEGCKGMINQGKIGCMVLGSWAYPQMVEAGPNGDDIGYMSFPITVNGKQYASAGADYSFGINKASTENEQIAAMLFVKWFTEQSGFAYSEGGIPIDKKGEYPAVYAAFEGIEFIPDTPAVAGEETLLNDMNAETELRFNAGGGASGTATYFIKMH